MVRGQAKRWRNAWQEVKTIKQLIVSCRAGMLSARQLIVTHDAGGVTRKTRGKN